MLTLTLWMRKEETMEGKCLAKITEWWKQASHHFALKFPHTFHWQHRCSGSPSARGQAAVLPTHVPHRPWGVWTPALVQLLGPLSRGEWAGPGTATQWACESGLLSSRCWACISSSRVITSGITGFSLCLYFGITWQAFGKNTLIWILTPRDSDVTKPSCGLDLGP